MIKYRHFSDFLEEKDQLKDGLGGEDYSGPLETKPNQPPSKGSNSKPLPYKNPYDDDAKDHVWVANGGDDKAGLGDDMTPGMTPKVSVPDGKKPESKVKHPKFVKMTSEAALKDGMSKKDTSKNKVMVVKDKENKAGLGDDKSPGMDPSKVITPPGKKGAEPIKYIKQKGKITSEEFIDKTKDMSNSEFAKYILDLDEHHTPDTTITTITDLHGNEFTPDPIQTIDYVTGILLANPRLMERFVRDVKRRDGLHILSEEVFEQPEAYDILVDMLEHSDGGENRCGKIARSMNNKYMSIMDNIELGESVGPPLQDRGIGGEAPAGRRGDKFGGGSPNGQVTKDPAYSTPTMPRQGGPFSGGGIGGSGGMDGAPQFADQEPLKTPGKGMNYLGESAAKNLVKSMAGYDHMKKIMKDHCTGPDC